ncbi:MAG: tRNA preQ1(34) S-adenosylmethionine ribosyltransferase-isomerase QueA [Clostridia bacterium]|nr:tRNA preQ1(34) S-adenosylmethionine ribosyltransferase-isomerase QueA [Clostridia bacterium]
MNLKDFNYSLPERLIAQTPLEQRDYSKLLILDKKTGEIKHEKFYNIINYLNKGDCLVLNDSRVIPARLIGVRKDTGSPIEFLLLNRKSSDVWEVIVRPGKRAKIGRKFLFGNELRAEVIDIISDGNRLVRFEYEGLFENVLDRLGEMPLPPYITEKLADKERYQTVYSKNNGSAAAPTAGLHFTKELLKKIEDNGIYIAYLTLHVGLGTFRPVKADVIENHKMHSEFYVLDEKNADIVNNARKNGGKIISVGTTSARTLETIADKDGFLKPSSGWTDIFIYPPYEFKAVDRLITNFHLPQSTLIMLVSAFAGIENVLNAYKIAVENEYRFFSFGDAMLIV